MRKVVKFEILKKIIDARAKELEFIKYIKKFRNKTIVVKYGGSALEETKNISYLIDIIFMKQQGIDVVLIHGGARQLNKLLNEHNIKYDVIDGIRVTTKEILKYAIIAFKEINKKIIDEINKKGKGEIKAIGLNGHEIPITISTFLNKERYQFVGQIKQVNIEYLKALSKEYIPVLSSLSQTEDNQPLNINADINAAAIAQELKAEKLIIMTDTPGIIDENGNLISSIDYFTIKKLIKNKVISKGMIPKVQASISALEGGVNKVHIISGTEPHSLAKEIFTDEGIGTEIIKNSNAEVINLRGT